MNGIKIGYARCSTDDQDVEVQRLALLEEGIEPKDIYSDSGFSGARRARPGLDRALGALRKGDTLCVTALDRLARSVRDMEEISDVVRERGAKLKVGGTVQDPDDPVSKMFFQMLSVFAEFERGLNSKRTKEGLRKARRRGRLRGRGPKLGQEAMEEVVRMYLEDDRSAGEIVARLFEVSKATVYRVLRKAGVYCSIDTGLSEGE